MERILKIKKKIGTLSKTETNPFFKSKYLDLNSLLNEIEPLLWEEGLILMQPIIEGEVFSILIDAKEGKELVRSGIQLPSITDPQKLGSCITYFRRYTLKSLLAISEEDDDGSHASKPEKPELTQKGFDYLKTHGTIEEIETALKERQMNTAKKQSLEISIKDLKNGNS